MRKKILFTLLTIIIIIISNLLTIEILKVKEDTDYKKLGLKIENHNIEYCIKYRYARFDKYKVYKIKNYYSDSMEKYQKQLEASKLWSKNKFYEYIMQEFYEMKNDDRIDIDRENLYYYNKKGIYAIFDLKNAKLYYFEKGIFNQHKDYNSILGIKTDTYENREIYSVKSGPQNDGTDYYVYKFNEEKGERIKENLNQNQIWNKERLSNELLENYKYNGEVNNIEDGYYYYKKICRTKNKSKNEYFTDENATGYELAVYDCNNNILYYYCTST